MKLILRCAESGAEGEITVAKTDLVTLLKARCHSIFPETNGKLISLIVGQKELEDSKFIGEYPFLNKETVVEVFVSENQPFSKVDYLKSVATFDNAKPEMAAKDFYDPKLSDEENEWDKTWTHGSEYLNYPPNIWKEGANPADSKRDSADNQATQSQLQPRVAHPLFANFSGYRNLNSSGYNFDTDFDFSALLNSGRSFRSLYVCNTRNFDFHTLHKLEGKWSGTAQHFCSNLNSSLSTTKETASSSKLAFEPNNKFWIEQQTFTTSDGLTSTAVFKYIPISDSLCEVLPLSKENNKSSGLKMTLEEQSHNILLITALDKNSNKVVFTETVVFDESDNSRNRTITRYNVLNSETQGLNSENNNNNNTSNKQEARMSFAVAVVVVCSEKKILDEETGQIESTFF